MVSEFGLEAYLPREFDTLNSTVKEDAYVQAITDWTGNKCAKSPKSKK